MTSLAPNQETPSSLDQLRALVGKELGPTAWHDVTQERIDEFAAATDDFQWIHVDPERAAASPLGTTIAHGLYTLSQGPKFGTELISFQGFAHALHYGYDRVRFPAPVPVGSRLRMRETVTDVTEVPGGAQITITQTFEIEGAEKPVCVAQSVARFYEHAAA